MNTKSKQETDTEYTPKPLCAGNISLIIILIIFLITAFDVKYGVISILVVFIMVICYIINDKPENYIINIDKKIEKNKS